MELQSLEAQTARPQDVETNHTGEVQQAEADFPDRDQRHTYVLPDQRNIFREAYQTMAKVITKKRLFCFSGNIRQRYFQAIMAFCDSTRRRNHQLATHSCTRYYHTRLKNREMRTSLRCETGGGTVGGYTSRCVLEAVS
ncbi:hypothetical protein FKM82_018638 [Ascaphus truei]